MKRPFLRSPEQLEKTYNCLPAHLRPVKDRMCSCVGDLVGKTSPSQHCAAELGIWWVKPVPASAGAHCAGIIEYLSSSYGAFPSNEARGF